MNTQTSSSLTNHLYANIYSIVWVDSKVPALQSRKPPVYCEYNSIYIEEQERNQEKTFYVCCFLCCWWSRFLCVIIQRERRSLPLILFMHHFIWTLILWYWKSIFHFLTVILIVTSESRYLFDTFQRHTFKMMISIIVRYRVQLVMHNFFSISLNILWFDLLHTHSFMILCFVAERMNWFFYVFLSYWL